MVDPKKRRYLYISLSVFSAIGLSLLLYFMLLRLQGRTHCVCTAVAVIMPGGERRDFAEISHVTFRRLDEAAIRHYMSLVHVYDKAGAYAIQEHGDMIIDDMLMCVSEEEDFEEHLEGKRHIYKIIGNES